MDAEMPLPPPNVQRVGMMVVMLRYMMILVRLLAEIAVSENEILQLKLEVMRKRNREVMQEEILLRFEADRSVRRDVLGVIIPRKKRRKSRFDWALGRNNIYRNYYVPDPIFDDGQFARTFRIKKSMADELLTYLANADEWFAETTSNKSGLPGIDPKAKLLISLKCMAYGVSPTCIYDFYQIGDTTAQQSIKKLCRLVRMSPDLNNRFLPKMTRADARRVCDMHKERYGVDGMIGSIDCMHSYWKNCPLADRATYVGKSGRPSLVLEAVADHNLFFWHAAFGYPGSHNDINILEQSPLWGSMLDGSFHREVDFQFDINDQTFQQLFVLADGIYPSSSRFCKTFSDPITEERIKFASWQESARKDIERAFGVLQRKFGILRHRFEQWYPEYIKDILYTTMLLHNWMVTDRVNRNEREDVDFYEPSPADDVGNQPDEDCANDDLAQMVRDDEEHAKLQKFVDDVMDKDAPDVKTIVAELTARKRMYKTEMTKLAHYRFARLYNKEEHIRLRQAIINAVQNQRVVEVDNY